MGVLAQASLLAFIVLNVKGHRIDFYNAVAAPNDQHGGGMFTDNLAHSANHHAYSTYPDSKLKPAPKYTETPLVVPQDPPAHADDIFARFQRMLSGMDQPALSGSTYQNKYEDLHHQKRYEALHQQPNNYHQKTYKELNQKRYEDMYQANGQEGVVNQNRHEYRQEITNPQNMYEVVNRQNGQGGDYSQYRQEAIDHLNDQQNRHEDVNRQNGQEYMKHYRHKGFEEARYPNQQVRSLSKYGNHDDYIESDGIQADVGGNQRDLSAMRFSKHKNNYEDVHYSQNTDKSIDDSTDDASNVDYVPYEEAGVPSYHNEEGAEVHYHKHKHVHDHKHTQDHKHEHDQEHIHAHVSQNEHKHKHQQDHSHAHHDYNTHAHKHLQEHKHEHTGEHKHGHAHKHDHNEEHKHEHHEDHKHGHDHHHGHDHTHGHHSEHKHDHHHGHKHSHDGEHKHNHQHGHKHDHKQWHKHGHKHNEQGKHWHDHSHEKKRHW